jgi:hypothetical protein
MDSPTIASMAFVYRRILSPTRIRNKASPSAESNTEAEIRTLKQGEGAKAWCFASTQACGWVRVGIPAAAGEEQPEG